MRFAKSFLAAFALAVVALSGSTTKATTAESSILWVDGDGYVDEIWFVFDGNGDLVLI